MYKHTLKFDSLADKHDAIDHIEGQLPLVGDVDECLTEKQVTFLTDVELSKRANRSLLLDTGAIEHLEVEI